LEKAYKWGCPVTTVKGKVVSGYGHFRERLKRENFRVACFKATGEWLIKGTVNVKVKRCIRIKEGFKVLGKDVCEEQDFLFEKCLINGTPAYRVRPSHPRTGSGGHGDDTLEIISSKEIPNVTLHAEVSISFLRDDIEPHD